MAATPSPPLTGGGLRIVAVLPNPHGDDRELEEVHVSNRGTSAIALSGWRITNAEGQQHWILTAQDGTVAPGQTIIVVRHGRSMSLRNSGDTVVLQNSAGQPVDARSYGSARSGKVFRFE